MIVVPQNDYDDDACILVSRIVSLLYLLLGRLMEIQTHSEKAGQR